MAEDHVMISLAPVVLILGVLVVAGIGWMFQHHHWRPFAGMFLLIAGVFAFFVLMRFSVQSEMQRAPATVAPSPPLSYFGVERTQETASGGRSQSRRVSSTPSTSTNSTVRIAENPVEAPSGSPQPTDTKPATNPPSWVTRPPQVEDLYNERNPQASRDGVYVATASSGRYVTPADCERAIIPAINEIVGNYAVDYVAEADGKPMALEPDYIRAYLIKDRYWEPVTSSVGAMNQLHVRLVFDSRVHDELDRRARAAKIDGRLKYTAAGTLAALLLLGGVYTLLKRGTTLKNPAA